MNSPIESQSVPYYFVSYSRQEVTFADSFSQELEKRGIRTWIDFRNLVPGKPWQSQLDDGVNNAAAILLVVSKESMASVPVKDEWTKSLAAGKRVILVIFEPCKLDDDLTGLEWVDFTQNFKKAMNQLTDLLKHPAQKMGSSPPQQGIRMPGAARMFNFLSVIALFLAIAGGIITLNLADEITLQEAISQFNLDGNSLPPPPSPFRDMVVAGMLISPFIAWIPAIWNLGRIRKKIRNRTHSAGQIKASLNLLLFANLFLLLIPLTMFNDKIWGNIDMTLAIGGILPGALMVMVLIFVVSFFLRRLMVSSSMYRWAGPAGAIIRVTKPKLPKNLKAAASMSVAIDAAPQDHPYKKELKKQITKAEYIYHEDIQESEVVLSLLSAYKSNSNCDPETTQVIPVLLQSCDVDPRLSQTQWVDLRYGQSSIDALVQLLDKPNVLMHTLGVLPVRTTILPSTVNRVIGLLSIVFGYSFFEALIRIVNGAATENWMNWNGSSILKEPGALLTFVSGLILPTLLSFGFYILRQYVIQRKLKYLNFLSYTWVLGFAVLLALLASFVDWLLKFMVILAWLVPLLMLAKGMRIWLPAAAR